MEEPLTLKSFMKQLGTTRIFTAKTSLNGEELDFLERTAAEAKLTLSAWMRSRLLACAEREHEEMLVVGEKRRAAEKENNSQ